MHVSCVLRMFPISFNLVHFYTRTEVTVKQYVGIAVYLGVLILISKTYLIPTRNHL